MNTSTKMAHVLGCVATAITFIATAPVMAQEVMDEIIVTAPNPGEADHSLDAWWFNQPKVRIDGTFDEDMDMWEYYLDMQDDYEECETLADAKVSQCKTVYSTQGSTLCALGVGYTLGLLGRFFPSEYVGSLIPAGTSVGILSCTDLNQTAQQWCETDFKGRVIQNCMDEDGS